jgi:hypothetical protein
LSLVAFSLIVYRTQGQNKDSCIRKIQSMIAEALLVPKEREVWTGISEETKKKRIDDKKRNSEKLKLRRGSKSWDDY